MDRRKPSGTATGFCKKTKTTFKSDREFKSTVLLLVQLAAHSFKRQIHNRIPMEIGFWNCSSRQRIHFSDKLEIRRPVCKLPLRDGQRVTYVRFCTPKGAYCLAEVWRARAERCYLKVVQSLNIHQWSRLTMLSHDRRTFLHACICTC